MNQNCKSLELIRNDIDNLDKQIIALIAKRMQKAAAVALNKQANGLEIFQPQREKEVYDNILNWSKEYEVSSLMIRKIFDCILAESKKQQKDLLNI